MQRLTRRRALLGALAGATTGVASAAGAGPFALSARAAPATLSFWGGWTGPDGLAMQRLVARFNAEVRDVQVTLTLYNWDLIFDRWRAEFDGGSPPDIVGIHATEVAEYAARGMLQEIGLEARQSGLVREAFLAAPWDLCRAEGGLYGIPLDVHPLGLYVNARAARRAGLDLGRPPRTGGDLLSWAARLTDHRAGTWGYAAPAGDVECVRQWYSLLYQHGGRFLNAQGTRCLAGGPAGVAAFGFLRDAVAAARVAMPEEGLVDADFLAGRVRMYAQGPWYIRGALQAGLPFVTAPMPVIGRLPAVWANSHVLGVVNSLDEGRVRAAMRFVAWLHAHALDWAEAGQIPASNAARARLPHTTIWPYLRPFAAMLPHVVYQPNVARQSALFAEQLATPLTTETRAVILGSRTPAQGARALAGGVDQVLAAAPGA